MKDSSISVLGIVIAAVANSVALQADQTDLHDSHVEQSQSTTRSTAMHTLFLLTTAEQAEYEQIMQGPEGHWYRDLDPTWVLGIAAKTEQQRLWYAHKAVEREHLRAEREVAFQRAYNLVWKARLKDFPIIDKHLWDANRVTHAVKAKERSASQEERLAVYIHVACSACESRLGAVLDLAKAGQSVDVFIDGLDDEKSIGEWATQAQIDPRHVRARRITLNAAGDSFTTYLAEADESTAFAVFRNSPLGYQRDVALEVAQ